MKFEILACVASKVLIEDIGFHYWENMRWYFAADNFESLA